MRRPTPTMSLALGLTLAAGGVPAPDLAAQDVEVHFAEAGLESPSPRDRALIREIVTGSVAEVRRLLPGLTGPIRVSVSVGPDVIEETGDAGAALEPGHILWVVDPSRPGGVAATARAQLRQTLFHELHHLARGYVMSGSAEPISLVDAVVSEGLATAFARDFADDDAPWGHYPPDVGAWVEELVALPHDASYRAWMFDHPDGRRWIGYRAGTFLADRAIDAADTSAAALVTTPTEEILELAGVAR